LVIGLVCLALAGTMLVVVQSKSQFAESQADVLTIGPVEEKSSESPIAVVVSIFVFAAIGVACTFSWGRPYTTRIAMGGLALSMVAMLLFMLIQGADRKGAMLYGGIIAICSGYYAVTGHYPEWLPLAEVFGTAKPESVPAPQAASIAQPDGMPRSQDPPKRVACRCGQQLRAAIGQAGQTVACPACGNTVTFPA
jgi:DNA-directed RNA polymerase subunit RPC12/RpoP